MLSEVIALEITIIIIISVDISTLRKSLSEHCEGGMKY